MPLQFDKVGEWSELKIQIIAEYARPYSEILTVKGFWHAYIDAFAGPGRHVRKATGEMISGSPLRALEVRPPFDQYQFIEEDQSKADELARQVGHRSDVTIFRGDCNEILRREIFPTIQWKDRRRALCLLDPYGLDLRWEVMLDAGQSKAVEMFLNFPVQDMNRTAIWWDYQSVPDEYRTRLTSFWGDESWKSVAYTEQSHLFSSEPTRYKEANAEIAEAFRRRLRDVAGFKRVSRPFPMNNTKNSTIYYLMHASHQPVAGKIVEEILAKHESKRRRNV